MRCLGRLPARHDRRTLKLSNYVQRWPAPPLSRDWTDKAPSWPIHQNDRLGNCAIVSQAHAVQCWTSQSGAQQVISDVDIVNAYRAVSGYDPARPETDIGSVMLDAVKYWRSTGVGGHKIEAFVSIDPRNRLEVEGAINLFGGCLLGLDMPLSVKTQTVWDVAAPGNHDQTFDRRSWGGHAVFSPLYSRVGIGVVTWGALRFATWEWVMTYAEEAYAALSPEWMSAAGRAPNGFNLEQLRADLAAIGA